jgi:hypothetical protein
MQPVIGIAPHDDVIALFIAANGISNLGKKPFDGCCIHASEERAER